MTGHATPESGIGEPRGFLGAEIFSPLAARAESAAGGRRDGGGHFALHQFGSERGPVRIGLGNRGQKGGGVRMARRFVQALRRGDLA